MAAIELTTQFSSASNTACRKPRRGSQSIAYSARIGIAFQGGGGARIEAV